MIHTACIASSPSPSRWLIFLHGIFGSGSNWRSFAKRLVDVSPEWGAVLVDLRMHGDSQHFPPPHTVDAAASDLLPLATIAPGPIRGVIGHSLGGKVGMRYTELRQGDLDLLWVIDTEPGLQTMPSLVTQQVIRFLEDAPPLFPSRDAFVQAAIHSGIQSGVARWLAMNLIHEEQQYRFKLDVPSVRALLEDHCTRDIWSFLENPGSVRIHYAVGGRSDVLQPQTPARLEKLPQVQVHRFPNAGHWIHIDATDALFAAIQESL